MNAVFVAVFITGAMILFHLIGGGYFHLTKDKEKALKSFKTSFNIIFILAIILMIMGAIGASKYKKWKEEGKQAVSLSIKQ